MITGYNTDVEYNGRVYHVQTEDKGTANPVIESLVYVGGEIVASKRTPYRELLTGGAGEAELVERVERQHHRMILDVRQGRYDPEGARIFGAGIISDRGFEEVVQEYLRQELSEEPFQVLLDSPEAFPDGETAELVVRIRGELTSLPISGARVAVKLITPEQPRTDLAEGATDTHGILRVPVSVPPLGDTAAAAILVEATAEGQTVQAQAPVRPRASG
jgi:hypothetical protein